jgi:hypothetical protein
VQFWGYVQGMTGKWSLELLERLVYANTVGVVVTNIAGAQFRSAIPGKSAKIVAELDYASDPSFVSAGTLAPGTIFSNGQSIATAPGTPSDPTAYINASGLNLTGSGSFTLSLTGILSAGHIYLLNSFTVLGQLTNSNTGGVCGYTLQLGIGAIIIASQVIVIPINTTLANSVPFEIDPGTILPLVNSGGELALKGTPFGTGTFSDLQVQQVAYTAQAVLIS